MNILTIKKEIVLKAPTTKVFDALTDPEQITGYWPLHSVTSSHTVSGPIIFKGEVAGSPFTDYGVIEKFDRPRFFKYNYWSDNHGTVDLPENRMTIEYVLRPQENGSVLSLTHTNLLTSERQAMMSEVWDFLLSRLKSYVENV